MNEEECKVTGPSNGEGDARKREEKGEGRSMGMDSSAKNKPARVNARY